MNNKGYAVWSSSIIEKVIYAQMVRKLTLSLELDMSYHVYRSLPLEHILS
jgi:hypothetical protein